MLNVPFNPYPVINAAGLFGTTSVGLISGTAFQDPSARFNLAGGILGASETLPMWGGVGISEAVTPNASSGTYPSATLGGAVIRATTLAANTAGSLTGFSVFDQNYSGVNSPSSPVPQVTNGGQVNFYRLGSNARVALPLAAGLVNLEGGIITQKVSWDFTNQQLIPYEGAFNAVTISGATWAVTSGGQASYTLGTDVSADLSAGDVVTISGVVSTGGTGAGYNGTFVVVSCSSTTLVVTLLSPSSPGTYSSGGTLAAGGGQLNVRVLDVQIGNSMVPVYNAVTGALTWNYAGNAAVVLL